MLHPGWGSPWVWLVWVVPPLVLAADALLRWRRLGRVRGMSPTLSLDLLASLPWGLLAYSLPLWPALKILLGWGILLKAPGLISTLGRSLGERVNPAVLRLLILVLWVFLAMHLIAGLWIAFAATRLPEDPVYEYVRALYWSVTTVTTIGYGDITPQTLEQTLFTITVQLFGAAVFSMVIANLASLIASLDLAKARHKERLERVGGFLHYKKIPRGLQAKVQDYFDYLWDSRRGFEEHRVLEDVPEPLKTDLRLYLHKDMIAKVPFLQQARVELVRDLVQALEPLVYPPEEWILRAGERADHMWFLSDGDVEVYAADGRLLAQLGPGAFFGEIALLDRSPRTASIKTRTYCDLYRLGRDDFEQILDQYPDFKNYIQELAAARRQGDPKAAAPGAGTASPA